MENNLSILLRLLFPHAKTLTNKPNETKNGVRAPVGIADWPNPKYTKTHLTSGSFLILLNFFFNNLPQHKHPPVFLTAKRSLVSRHTHHDLVQHNAGDRYTSRPGGLEDATQNSPDHQNELHQISPYMLLTFATSHLPSATRAYPAINRLNHFWGC